MPIAHVQTGLTHENYMQPNQLVQKIQYLVWNKRKSELSRFNHYLNKILLYFKISQYVIAEILNVMKVSNWLRQDALYLK